MGLLKKITKPISKILDKIIPNEIKPALPFLSAAAPFLLPASGIMSGMVGRGLTMGGLNLASQLSQEGSEGDFSGLSALLAAATGAMTSPDAPQFFQGMQKDVPYKDVMTDTVISPTQDTGIMTSIKDAIGKGGETASQWLQTQGDILRPGGEAMTMKNVLPAIAVPASQGMGDLAMADARRALRDFERQLEETGDIGSDEDRALAIRLAMEAGGHSEETIVETIRSLGYKQGGKVGLRNGGRIGFDNGGFNYSDFGKDRYMSELFEDYSGILSGGEQFFDKVDEQVATGKFPEPEKLKGWLKEYEDLEDKIEKTEDRYENFDIMLGDDETTDIDKLKFYENKEKELEKREATLDERNKATLLDNLDASEITRTPDFQAWLKLYEAKDPRAKSHPYHEEFEQVLMSILPGRDESYLKATDYDAWKKNGGRINKEGGGMMSVLPKGTEMDYRGGGMIPMGSKEKADDVPARLSKNEFVMTADAVRAAGGGSVNVGAKRMYDLMHNLEARV